MIKYRKSVLRNLRGIGVSADTARKYFTPMSPEQRKLLDEKGTLLETPELEPPKVEQLALAASVVPSPVGAGPGFGFATHVINNYRIGMILNPVAGINKADLGMGPSATRNLQ